LARPAAAAGLVVDGFIFVTNPLHVPAGNLPARLLGLQSFQELDPSMEPTFSEKTNLLVSAWPYWHGNPVREILWPSPIHPITHRPTSSG